MAQKLLSCRKQLQTFLPRYPATSGSRIAYGYPAMARAKYLLGIGTIFAALLLNGCAGVGLTLFGVGAGVTAGTSVAYTLDGIAYRTFTAPLPRVESATRTALDRMGIKVEATAKIEQGKAIKAVSNDRDIEIELEMVSPKTTRIRTVAKQGIFFKDRATATEIIIQTEKALGIG